MQIFNIRNIFYLHRRKGIGIIIFIFLFFYLKSFSQEQVPKMLPILEYQRFVFGFEFGSLFTKFDVQPSKNGFIGRSNNIYEGENKAQSLYTGGFYAGGYMSMALTENYLKLLFGAHGGISKMLIKYNTSSSEFVSALGRKYKSSDSQRMSEIYLFYVPILLQLAPLRINNYKPFVYAGISYMYNFGSNETYDGDNRDEVFRMKTSMYNFEIGVGCDFYLYNFKFTPSIKVIRGINNLLVRDNAPTPWTDSIDKMYFNSISFSLVFSGNK